VDQRPAEGGIVGEAPGPTPDAAELPSRVAALAARLSPRIRALAGHELKRHTSFQIGGPADLFVEPDSVEDLAAALAAADELGVPVTVLGGGTNVLVADAGIRGMVVHLGKAFAYIRELGADEGGVDIEAGAATRFIRLAKDTVSRGLGGLEFAAGIPGSVGGAAQMNAGAFGGEISQTLTQMVYVTRDGKIVEKLRKDLQFSYRKLAFDAGAVITSTRFRLHRSPMAKLQQAVARVQEKRRRNQPVGYPNAGSIFKNPPGEYAGRLIEKAGLKGTTKGGAQVSAEHANFLVNLGTATAADVRGLMVLVQEEVWTRCGVWLEPEVRFLGDYGQADEERSSRP
jgi:UDP-N-acetylmuramate dehydrogenase